MCLNSNCTVSPCLLTIDLLLLPAGLIALSCGQHSMWTATE